jgi:hypothetical protein
MEKFTTIRTHGPDALQVQNTVQIRGKSLSPIHWRKQYGIWNGRGEGKSAQGIMRSICKLPRSTVTFSKCPGTVLCYKPEGRRFEFRMRWTFFNLPYPSSRTMAPGVDSASNKNECRKSSWGGEGRPAHTTSPQSVSRMSENVGASTSRIPKGLYMDHSSSRKVQQSLYVTGNMLTAVAAVPSDTGQTWCVSTRPLSPDLMPLDIFL